MISKDSPNHKSGISKSKFQFVPHEVAIYGTSCEAITDLVKLCGEFTGATVKLGYVDAEHHESPPFTLAGHYHVQENGVVYTDAIRPGAIRSFQLLSSLDLVLVNGNHFEASSQIVIVNPKKETSLLKRKDQLTNVIALVSDYGVIPEYILSVIPNAVELPLFSESDHQGLLLFLMEKTKTTTPVQGLVLVGGESRRMGKDKALISEYFDKPMFRVMGDLLLSLDMQVYFSCPSSKRANYPADLAVVEDRMLGMGPLSGIVSAFLSNPQCAWLVVACDLPMLDHDTLNQLIAKRNPSKIATAFVHADSGLPEPLITIWEPKSFSTIMSAIAMGITCPRKILLQSDFEKVVIGDSLKLMNANTPEDLALAQSKLR